MRDHLFHGTTSATLALLRRAMTGHRATTTADGPRARAVRPEPRASMRAFAQAGGDEGRVVRRADPEASPSRTERQLQVLGVGQPPDRAETGIPGVRW